MLLRLIAALSMLLTSLFLATSSQAHGPTRQKFALTTEVPAAPADVWAVIGNFQDMSWHPRCPFHDRAKAAMRKTLRGS